MEMLGDNTGSSGHLSRGTVLADHRPAAARQTALAIFSVSPFLFWVCNLFPEDGF